jgi:hypothetical protein
VRRTVQVDVSGGSTAAAVVWISLATPEKACESIPPILPGAKGLKTWCIDEVMLVDLQSPPNPLVKIDESYHLNVLF